MSKGVLASENNSNRTILRVSVVLIALIAVFFTGANFASTLTGRYTGTTGDLIVTSTPSGIGYTASITKCGTSACSGPFTFIYKSTTPYTKTDMQPGYYHVIFIDPTNIVRGFKNVQVTAGAAVTADFVFPSCNDGVKNQGEMWADCGGPCAPCYAPECKPVIVNGDPRKNMFNFIIVYFNLSQNEIDKNGSAIASSQFYRSQYDKPLKRDPNFGFIPWLPNQFFTRVGLFEIEPFKSNITKFNVFYINKSLPIGISREDHATQYCTFMSTFSTANKTTSTYSLKHKSTTGSHWDIESMGTAWNHEIAHRFGLFDEYYSEMGKNHLTAIQINDWNKRIPNCDYGRPFTNQDYATGNGYCKKWCNGVDPDKYKLYFDFRGLYDQCADLLRSKTGEEGWLTFCKGNLNFSRIHSSRGYPFFAYGGLYSFTTNLEGACKKIYSDPQTDPAQRDFNIQYFCNLGSSYNIWDLNIGKGCTSDTGCYAGCGGFNRSAYGSPNSAYGAFGDAFRSDSTGIMGGGPFANSVLDDLIYPPHSSNDVPSYGGDYNVQLIRNNFRYPK